MIPSSKQKGFTFTEMMVAMAVSTLLLAAVLNFFAARMSHQQIAGNTNMLNVQLETAMQIMVNEIRRAGYSSTANADIGLDRNTNAFMAAGADMDTSTANCILFTYDAGNTGVLPAISNASDDDRYGFRLNSNAVQTRPPGATYSCGAAATNWENMTDPGIVKITALTFTPTNTTVKITAALPYGVIMRSIDITLTGQLANNAAVSRTLTQHVRVRNDKYLP